MLKCGGCQKRGNAINRVSRPNVSLTKTASYIAKSGLRDIRQLAHSSLAKIQRRRP